MNNRMKVNKGTHYACCPVCNSGAVHWADKVHKGIIYKIDRCVSCRYAFVNPRPSLAFLMDYYESSGHVPGVGLTETDELRLENVQTMEKSFPNSTLDAKRILKGVERLLSASHVKTFLDVGCGYGFFSKEAQNHGFAVSMLELAKNERAISKELTGIEPDACSFEDYDESKGPFSVVLMSQILEHALDVNLWIRKASSLLVSGGLICIAVPNFGSIYRHVMQANEPFITPPTHLNFFDAKSLSLLLEKHGFSVECSESVSRISTASLSRRMPSFLKPVRRVVDFSARTSISAFDPFGMGMIINVYGRKI
jgi:SAM-dependent methyltransferase